MFAIAGEGEGPCHSPALVISRADAVDSKKRTIAVAR
jgi:hypothetical protein